jgi:hypothetical protein
VQTKSLRPSVLPAILGSNFFLVGYRAFVRYRTVKGNHLRGLYILGSQTDSKRMTLLGNLFTHYRYSTIDVEPIFENGMISVTSSEADLKIVLGAKNATPQLPNDSPFATWAEARRFAGPLPFTFSYDPASRRVLIVEGVRQRWQPRPIEVLAHRVGFFDALDIKPKLANAFIVEDIPYSWKKGRTEKWDG